MTSTRLLRPFIKYAMVAAAMAPLALFAHLGQFTRFISDDYLTTYIGIRHGPIGGLIYWYNSWSASYTRSLVVSSMAALDTLAVRVMPGLVLVVWLVGLVWLMRQGLSILRVRKHATAISISVSALLLAAIVNAFYTFTVSVLVRRRCRLCARYGFVYEFMWP